MFDHGTNSLRWRLANLSIPLTPTSFFVGVALFVAVICQATFITTSIAFHRSVSRRHNPTSQTFCPPPMLPYCVPILGHALSFLNKTPGSFWRALQHTLTTHNISI